MINSRTSPIFLNDTIAESLIEIDTPSMYEKWKYKLEI